MIDRLARLIGPDPTGEFVFEVPEYLVQALQRIVRTRDAEFEAILKPMGLGVTRYRILTAVVVAGGCTMSDLAVLIGYDRTTMVRAVDQLVQADLVRRTVVEGDRRSIKLRATTQGEAAFARTIEVIERQNAKLLAGLTEDQLRAVMRGLEQMLANLNLAPADIAGKLGPHWE
ncbi:MAG TPA: MarR family transcriptional regulator [Caulobacteraceae bacterium]|nr:MarR family transcriptional regulator [Caulobacteraceae bacterium]